MGTVSGTYGKQLVDRIIKDNDGWPEDKEVAPDNPRVVKIVEYTTPEGETCWGLVFENERGARISRYEIASLYVRKPRVIWELKE